MHHDDHPKKKDPIRVAKTILSRARLVWCVLKIRCQTNGGVHAKDYAIWWPACNGHPKTVECFSRSIFLSFHWQRPTLCGVLLSSPPTFHPLFSRAFTLSTSHRRTRWGDAKINVTANHLPFVCLKLDCAARQKARLWCLSHRTNASTGWMAKVNNLVSCV